MNAESLPDRVDTGGLNYAEIARRCEVHYQTAWNHLHADANGHYAQPSARCRRILSEMGVKLPERKEV